MQLELMHDKLPPVGKFVAIYNDGGIGFAIGLDRLLLA